MRRVQIVIEAEIAEGALQDADRFARRVLKETAEFGVDGKPDWVSLRSSGFSGPFEYDWGLRPDAKEPGP